MDAANAGCIRFKFRNLICGQHPQPIQPILVAAPIQFVKPRQFTLSGRDDDFAAHLVRHCIFSAELQESLSPINA